MHVAQIDCGVAPAQGVHQASKRLVSIMFHRGAEIPGDHRRLEGDGRLARTMRFSDLEQLEAGRADLEAAIRAWCDWKAGASTAG